MRPSSGSRTAVVVPDSRATVSATAGGASRSVSTVVAPLSRTARTRLASAFGVGSVSGARPSERDLPEPVPGGQVAERGVARDERSPSHSGRALGGTRRRACGAWRRRDPRRRGRRAPGRSRARPRRSGSGRARRAGRARRGHAAGARCRGRRGPARSARRPQPRPRAETHAPTYTTSAASCTRPTSRAVSSRSCGSAPGGVRSVTRTPSPATCSAAYASG